jgi:hypothetical protein
VSAMTQTEWAARVAAIGALAGWHNGRISLLCGLPPGYGVLSWMEDAVTDPAVIAAIRQLLVDWLAGEGVVANRVCRWQCVGDGNWQCDCGHTAPYMQVAKWHYCPACGGKIEVTA